MTVLTAVHFCQLLYTLINTARRVAALLPFAFISYNSSLFNAFFFLSPFFPATLLISHASAPRLSAGPTACASAGQNCVANYKIRCTFATPHRTAPRSAAPSSTRPYAARRLSADKPLYLRAALARQ